MRFNGKTVLTTGGTYGIGLAAAQRFSDHGASVIVSGRNASRGAQVPAMPYAHPG
jgi:short-subunit dehydrogenase involved in D-alanine esterification of teichoic acids